MCGTAVSALVAAPGKLDVLHFPDIFLIRGHVPVEDQTGRTINQPIHDYL